jgi:TRAP-type C4-dicarboxylate transport system substrate-binding protein
MTSKKLDSMPGDLKSILLDTGKVAASALTTRIRNEDAAAFGRMKGKMTVIDLTADEKNKWQGIFKQVRARLGQGTFPTETVTKLEGMSG